MRNHFRLLKLPIVLTFMCLMLGSISGCVVVSVASATVSVATTVVSTGVAVGSTAVSATTSVVKGVAKVVTNSDDSAEGAADDSQHNVGDNSASSK